MAVTFPFMGGLYLVGFGCVGVLKCIPQGGAHGLAHCAASRN